MQTFEYHQNHLKVLLQTRIYIHIIGEANSDREWEIKAFLSFRLFSPSWIGKHLLSLGQATNSTTKTTKTT